MHYSSYIHYVLKFGLILSFLLVLVDVSLQSKQDYFQVTSNYTKLGLRLFGGNGNAIANHDFNTMFFMSEYEQALSEENNYIAIFR